ncbi:MAG: hypothetical protein HYW79_03430 [Parcubacteria group bacterium]|nr:hypothetical protein [Parcubacteria group bacterium]
MAELYLAIIGHTATGKESTYIAAKEALAGKLTVSIHHFSDPLSEALDLFCLEKSRPNQQLLSTILRQAFGENMLGNIIFKRVLADPADIVFLDGVRRPKDVEMLKNLPNSFLGYVYAPPEEAYKRLVLRNDRPGDAEKTWEQFLAEQSAETESLIDTLRPLADFTLDNHMHDPEFKFLRTQVVSLIYDEFDL